MRGARAVHAAVENSSHLAGLLVWIHMRPGDDRAAVRRWTAALAGARLQHFHDPRRRAGKAFAPSVGAGGSVVWDAYLGFDPGPVWEEEPPAPQVWAHQLTAGWADPNRYRSGESLRKWLREFCAA